MSKESDLAYLRECTAIITASDDARRRRDDRVREMMAARVATAREIMAVTGLSRPRVYQLAEDKVSPEG